jgi:hypothetical protein
MVLHMLFKEGGNKVVAVVISLCHNDLGTSEKGVVAEYRLKLLCTELLL